MIIYIVAGERNIQAVDFFGGLYFNLGQTDRSVEERLKDPDYRRKNAGGKWVILHEWEVEDSLTDSVFHEILEDSGINRSGTNNTEEFFAPGDDGTADEAAKIVQDYINEHSVQKVKYENIRLKAFLAYRDAQLEELSKEFAELNDEYQNYKLTDASKLIDDALKEKEEVEQQVADLLEETRKKEEELEQKIKDVKTRQIYLDKVIEITEEDKRWIEANKNKVNPVKLKLDDIKDFFSSWTWVWLIVLFFSLVECSDRGKKNDWTDEREAILRNESKKVEQKNKIIKRLEKLNENLNEDKKLCDEMDKAAKKLQESCRVISKDNESLTDSNTKLLKENKKLRSKKRKIVKTRKNKKKVQVKQRKKSSKKPLTFAGCRATCNAKHRKCLKTGEWRTDSGSYRDFSAGVWSCQIYANECHKKCTTLNNLGEFN